MLLHCFISCLFFLPSFSLYVLMPLYIYPENGTWKPVWDTIAAYPKVQFQIIINPDSGPGSSQYPDDAYITALTRLNKFPNVKLIGYVYTGYASRPLSDTIKDIDTYAGWASYTKSNITVSGIFFDEATDSIAAAPKEYMQNISAHAYTQISSVKTTVVFNPGCLVDKSYFSLADTIVEFESPLSSYFPLKTINSFQKGYKKQTAIIVHSAAGVGAVKLKTMVQRAKTGNVGGIYFTSDCCYNGINATLLAGTAAAIAA